MGENVKKLPHLAILANYHLLAIELRYKGWRYSDIVTEIYKQTGVEIKEGTIKFWFKRSGPLAEAYREWADEMVNLEIEEVRDIFRGNLKSAAKILIAGMAGSAKLPQIIAAEKFLDRGMGKTDQQPPAENNISVININVVGSKHNNNISEKLPVDQANSG